MRIEIQKPELERRVREGIQSGRFQDVDDLLTKALDAPEAGDSTGWPMVASWLKGRGRAPTRKYWAG